MVAQHTVILQPLGMTAEASAGEIIADVARRAGVPLALPCGHQGRCGRCTVRIETGHVRRRSNGHLSPQEAADGWVLACQAEIIGNVVVQIPPQRLRERLVDTGVQRPPVDVTLPAVVVPAVRKVLLELPPPTLEDNLNDWERVRRGLQQVDDAIDVQADIRLLRRLSSQLRAADWRVTAVVGDDRRGGAGRLIDVQAGDTTRSLLGVAVDIGTTTVVVSLVNLRNGRVLETAAEYNDQIAFGEDVISRIVYSRQGNGDGLRRLRDMGLQTINRLIAQACRQRRVDPTQVLDVVVAGNTTMTHIFHGLDPQHLRSEPYVPTANHYPPARAEEAGVEVHPEAGIWTYPTVAAYVGGDITSGVVASGQFRTDKLTLFMDVGTNGELVLGNSDWLVTCACSAGPAFEGAGVRCGMRATTGAIEEITVDPATLEPSVSVIGDARPVGICGSGMISALAEMFITGVVDRQGRIDVERIRRRAANPARVRKGDHGGEYVLAWASESETGSDIVLTEVDVDNLVRTKAAIFAGITSLLKSVGLGVEDVEQVLIGGSFGQHIDFEHAIRIGLLPDLPWDRFRFLGNTSLLGARQALISADLRGVADEIAGKMTYLELVADSSFYGEYTSAMFLPHTDLELFPSVESALRGAGADV